MALTKEILALLIPNDEFAKEVIKHYESAVFINNIDRIKSTLN